MGYVMRRTDEMGPFTVETRRESAIIIPDNGVDAFFTSMRRVGPGEASGGIALYIEVGHEHLDALAAAVEVAQYARDHGGPEWEVGNAEAIQARERREQGEYVDALLARAGWGPRS